MHTFENGNSPSSELHTHPEMLKSLYETDDYGFLAAYKEILGERLTQCDIIGEGANGIVLKRPKNHEVIKVRKPGMDVDDLGREIVCHSKILSLLNEWQSQVNDDSRMDISVPSIIQTDGNGFIKRFFFMEKIIGQNLTSKMFRENHVGLQGENPDYLDSLSDKDIVNLLLLKYREKSETILGLFRENSKQYVTSFIQKRSDLQDFMRYLKYHGIEHDDLHSSNIMVDQKGIAYLIDFGRMKWSKPAHAEKAGI